MASEIKDINLAPSGEKKIEWVKRNCDLLRTLEEEFIKTKPFAGKKIALSGSDVICLRTAQGDSFIIRPSGTEPKIRNYIMISGADAAECAAKAEVFLAAAKEIMAKKD